MRVVRLSSLGNECVPNSTCTCQNTARLPSPANLSDTAVHTLKALKFLTLNRIKTVGLADSVQLSVKPSAPRWTQPSGVSEAGELNTPAALEDASASW